LGTVTDMETGEPVAGVRIYDNEAGKSFQTDEEGKFSIKNLSPGTYNLFFYSLGYEIITRSFEVDGDDLNVSIKLEPLNREMTEVAVIGQRDQLFAMQRLRQVEGTSIFAGS